MLSRTHTHGRRAMARPRTGQTPVRYVRLGDEIWEKVEWIAQLDSCSNTEVVRDALREYIAKRVRMHRSEARRQAADE